MMLHRGCPFVRRPDHQGNPHHPRVRGTSGRHGVILETLLQGHGAREKTSGIPRDCGRLRLGGSRASRDTFSSERDPCRRAVSPLLLRPPLSLVLPVEVRCHISCFRCLVRNARCNTMSHPTADGCTCLARNA